MTEEWFILLRLSTITVLTFERRVVHVVIILSTDNVLGLTEEWLMLLRLSIILSDRGVVHCFVILRYDRLRFNRSGSSY